jgi:hypothetical protein
MSWSPDCGCDENSIMAPDGVKSINSPPPIKEVVTEEFSESDMGIIKDDTIAGSFIGGYTGSFAGTIIGDILNGTITDEKSGTFIGTIIGTTTDNGIFTGVIIGTISRIVITHTPHIL